MTNTKTTKTNNVKLHFYAVAPIGWEGDWATVLSPTDEIEDIMHGIILENADCYDEICSYRNKKSNGSYSAKCIIDGETCQCEVVEQAPYSFAIVPLENEEQRVWW